MGAVEHTDISDVGTDEQSTSIIRQDDSISSPSLVMSDNILTDSDISEYGALEADNNLHFACANARSVVHKIGSLITSFEENKLHLMLLTETWLNAKHCPPRVMNDLTIGANLNFIRRRGGAEV